MRPPTHPFEFSAKICHSYDVECKRSDNLLMEGVARVQIVIRVTLPSIARKNPDQRDHPSSNVVTPNISSSGCGTGSWVE